MGYNYDEVNNKWYGKRLSVYDSEELSALEMIANMNTTTNDLVEYKTDKKGDHEGSWCGLYPPTLSEEGLRATVEKIVDEDLPTINSSLDSMNNYFSNGVIASKFNTLNEAVNYAIQTGEKNIILSNKTYTINEPIRNEGKDISFIGNGAEIVQKSNVDMFILDGNVTLLNTLPTADINDISIDFSANNGGSTPTTSLKVDDTTKYNINDVILLSETNINNISEDTYHEYATVRGIDQTSKLIYLSFRKRFNYYNGAYVYKINGNVSFDNITIKTINDTKDWHNFGIWCSFLKNVSIKNVKVVSGCDRALNINKCYSYNISNCEINNLLNLNTGQTYSHVGYGINDIGSSNGIVSNCIFSNCRHGVTTNGRTYNLNVNNCVANNCSASGFDTHKNSYLVSFNNCNVIGSYQGDQSSGAGFSNRGIKTYFNNCIGDNLSSGFQFFDSSDEVFIKNCMLNNIKYVAVKSSIGKIYIHNSIFETYGNGYATTFENSDVEIINSKIKHLSSSGTNNACILATTSKLKIQNCILDMSENKGTNSQFIRGNKIVDIKIKGLELLQGTSSVNHLFVDDNDINSKWYIKNVFGDFQSTSTYNISNLKAEIIGENVSNSTIPETIVYSTSKIPVTIQSKLNNVIILNAKPNSSSSTYVGGVTGNIIGQILNIRNVGTSVLNIAESGEMLSITTAKVIQPNKSITLIWDGVNWTDV